MGTELTYVGKRLPSISAVDKALGKVKYSIDIKLPGALIGKILTSPHAHALIKSIDTSEAEKLPGVAAVVTFKDIPKKLVNPGVLKFMHYHPANDIEDMYIMAGDKVRYVGEIVAAVAAVDEATAVEALKLIKVDYEVLPATYNPIDAMKPGSAKVHENAENNISQTFSFPGNRGDVDAAFAEADVQVELDVSTSRQHMMTLEPLSCTAYYDRQKRELTCWTPNQRPITIRKQLAELFDMPEGKINIICEYAGGFFGEGNFPIVPVCVTLAKKVSKPVRLEYTREEHIMETPSREVYLISGKLAFKKDGTLLAGTQNLTVDSGAYFNRSNATSVPCMGSFQGNYRMPVFKGEMKAVYSNTPTTSGSRGYGTPQALFILEQLMDMAAEKLGMDRLEIRKKNFKRMGEYAIQHPMETETQERVMMLGAEKIGWEQKKSRNKEDGVWRHGIGMCNYFDVTGGQPRERMDRQCMMTLEEDGSVTVIQNHADGGMNLLGSATQVAAEVSGLRFEDFRHIHGETRGALYDMGLAANAGMYGMGNLYAKAALALRNKILAVAAQMLNVEPDILDIKNSEIFVKGEARSRLTVKEVANHSVYKLGPTHQITVTESFMPYLNPSAVGSTFVDLRVDIETGDIVIDKLVIVHDCGRAINPMVVEGQLQGALTHGLGYTLYEDMCISQVNGSVLADNYNKYKLPSALDMPDMEVVIFEEPTKSGPFGAKGVGMSGVMGVPAAIANAIYDAVGVRITEMPITPEKVLAAIKSKNR
jgi:xanthine dehydrogenase molybdenum-binding subunit